MIIYHEGKNWRLPDFLIVGAAKSGTTSLHYYLKQHPQIFMPKVKELWFFAYRGEPPSCIPLWLKDEWGLRFSDLSDYTRHFADAGENQIIGEISPIYLYRYEKTISNIKEVYEGKYKHLKIIMILRNPIERAWSHFVMNKRDGNEELDNFMEAIRDDVVRQRLKSLGIPSYDYCGMGLYLPGVKAYLNEFLKVKVILYDDLCADSIKVVKEVFGFLGVDDEFIPDTAKRYNISGEPKSKILDYLIAKRNPIKTALKCILPYHIRSKMKYLAFNYILKKRPMPEEVRQFLRNYYRDSIIALSQLIHRDLSEWLK